MRITTFAFGAALSLVAIACGRKDGGASAAAPEIITTGTGEVTVPPDRVEITVAVVVVARTAAQAGRANAERMSAVLAALKRQGLPDSALKTSGYSVDEDIDYGRTGPRGPREYAARNAVRIVTDQLDAVGSILDTSLAAGATAIAGITFRSSREVEARQRAIDGAVRAARTDAMTAAAAAGRTLGAIIEIELYPSRPFGLGREVMRLEQVTVTSTPMMPSDIPVAVTARVRSVLGSKLSNGVQ